MPHTPSPPPKQQAATATKTTAAAESGGSSPAARRTQQRSCYHHLVPAVTASPAALPTINHRILQRHADQYQALQQHMLEQHLLGASAAPCTRHRHQTQHCDADFGEAATGDDAVLPVPRYGYMSDLALPERDPGTFEAWRAEMQQRLRRHSGLLS